MWRANGPEIFCGELGRLGSTLRAWQAFDGRFRQVEYLISRG